jgi:hypothetical protein
MPDPTSVPDTYFYFIVGYFVLWLILFGAIACALVKLDRLEKS